jgi:hypothetical protein
MSGRSPKKKRIPIISIIILSTVAAVPCSAQKAQAPLPPAAAQTMKQDAMAPFTHAEVVQFYGTVQAQAMSWKETVSSIEPSTLHLADQTSKVIEDQKSHLLYYLGDIAKLRTDGDAKYKGLDLKTTARADSLIVVAGEFGLFNDICEFKDGVNSLAGTLVDYPSGQFNAGSLTEIYTQAQMLKDTLFLEAVA